jgi:hypothetical protein
MKQIFLPKKIGGHWCVFYVNEKGAMWFGVIDGKPYGSYEILENPSDLQEHAMVMQQNANEVINKVKTL